MSIHGWTNLFVIGAPVHYWTFPSPWSGQMANCYVCTHEWVEYDTLCGEGVCSEQCKLVHQGWCSWCVYVHFNKLNPPKEAPTGG